MEAVRSITTLIAQPNDPTILNRRNHRRAAFSGSLLPKLTDFHAYQRLPVYGKPRRYVSHGRGGDNKTAKLYSQIKLHD